MPDALDRFRRDHIPSFLAYLTRRDEAGRRSAYELGRWAMHDSIGLLEVVRVHNEAAVSVMSTAKDAAGSVEVASAAAEFLLELLSPFEMAQRGFMDVGVRRNQPDVPGRSARPPAIEP